MSIQKPTREETEALELYQVLMRAALSSGQPKPILEAVKEWPTWAGSEPFELQVLTAPLDGNINEAAP
jgi:hypothetical protein